MPRSMIERLDRIAEAFETTAFVAAGQPAPTD